MGMSLNYVDVLKAVASVAVVSQRFYLILHGFQSSSWKQRVQFRICVASVALTQGLLNSDRLNYHAFYFDGQAGCHGCHDRGGSYRLGHGGRGKHHGETGRLM